MATKHLRQSLIDYVLHIYETRGGGLPAAIELATVALPGDAEQLLDARGAFALNHAVEWKHIRRQWSEALRIKRNRNAGRELDINEDEDYGLSKQIVVIDGHRVALYLTIDGTSQFEVCDCGASTEPLADGDQGDPCEHILAALSDQ